jgi:hypothetical protein
VNYDPNQDERHYQPRGRLERKISGTLPAVALDAGKQLVTSWRPTVSADGKQRVSLVTALLLACLLAGAVGWGAYELGRARGYIEGSALFRPTAAH